MAIALTVGGHMDHLRRGSLGSKPRSQPPGKILAVIENSFEGDGARDGAVVEEDGNASPLLQPNQVGMVGIDRGIGSLDPASDAPSNLSRTGCRVLSARSRTRAHWWGARMVNRMPFCANRSRVSVSTAVSASHMPSGLRPKRCSKVGDAPADLGHPVTGDWPAA